MDSVVSWFSGIMPQGLLFLMALVGAAISQLLSFYKNFEGCTPFLKKAFPKRKERWYYIWNAIILTFIGALLPFIVLEPETVKASLLAGLTWCGTLQSLGIPVDKDHD